MSWLHSQGLAALAGLALVLAAIWMTTEKNGTWKRGVLFLASLAYVASSFAKDGDYSQRIFILCTIGLLWCIGIHIRFAWTAGWTAWWMKAFTVSFVGISMWIWMLRGAPNKLWVIIASVVVLSAWLLVAVMKPGVSPLDYDDTYDDPQSRFVDVEATPIPTLLERDALVLQALYDATNGRVGVWVSPWAIYDSTSLTDEQVDIATDRLRSRGSIDTDETGYALKRKGVDAVERSHRVGRRSSVTENHTYNFHGNTTGVFGSQQNVTGNSFHTEGVPLHLVEDAIAAAANLHSQIAPLESFELGIASDELRDAGTDPHRLKRAARRLADVAGSVGEIGAPLLKLTMDILKALNG